MGPNKNVRGVSMTELERLTDDYVKALQQSEVTQSYFKQKEIVSADPELKGQIDEFRRRNFQLQNETDPDRLFDAVDQFEREFKEFRENPMVSDFLAAELAFCRQYQEIQERIATAFAIDFDLGM